MSEKMKTIIYYIGIGLVVIGLIFACVGVYRTYTNKQIFDFNQRFDYGILKLPDDTIVYGKVQYWKDFDDGDQMQVKINDVTYLVHSVNAALYTK